MKYNYEDICGRVCGVAREAGEYIARESKSFSASDIEHKGRHDLVSYVDKSAEELIVGRLREIVPEAGFITEEGSAGHNGEELTWIVDPLDGTTNFVHGTPPYCVSIALASGNEVVAGVVYEVTHEELFYAWQGSDAYLNGEKISVSKVRRLEDSLVSLGFSYNDDNALPEILERLAWYQRNTNGIRRTGSATANVVYVACGRFDAFAQKKLAPWDIAAGAIIAERAGAVVSDYNGGKDYLFGREFVATNEYIYAEFMKTIR